MHKIKTLIIGLFLAVISVFSLASPAFAQPDIAGGLCTGANLQISETPSQNSCSTSDATERVNNLIHRVINIFSAVVGIIAVIMIIVGGLRYITSGGNDASVTSAKNTLLYAIIGLIIVALAQIIVRFTLSKIANS